MAGHDNEIPNQENTARADVAAWLMAHGYNCAQAICAVFGPRLGLPESLALSVASGFGGGMARRAETCGAVTGALTILGLRFGGDKTLVYAKAREFFDKFKARHDSIVCRELLPYDISTEAGHKAAKEEGLFGSACIEYVRTAAEILDEMIAQK